MNEEQAFLAIAAGAVFLLPAFADDFSFADGAFPFNVLSMAKPGEHLKSDSDTLWYVVDLE